MERAEQVREPTERPAADAGASAGAATPDAPVESRLSLAAVSDDRATLLLIDERGTTFTLPVTPSLRAALRGDASRHGQLETTMTSALRPRDIQARIRSGESAEQVAQAAQTTVDKIMAFVQPVLAERQHVAERAQKAHVRRPAGEQTGSGGRTLGEAVETHLRALNLDPAGVEWDSWRREDGRWTLTAGYALPVRTGTAHFTFDVPGSYVVLDDEDARWLVGEVVPTPAPARDDLSPGRERRLSSVAQDELPLGDDAIELVSGAEPVPETGDVDVPLDEPVQAMLDVSPDSDDPAVREEAADAAAADPDPAEPMLPQDPPRRAAPKKRGRASVPSWDEIMFGGPSEQ